MKFLLAISIALLPSAALAEQFTPQQMLDVMSKSPSNRDVRVHDGDGDYEFGWHDGHDGPDDHRGEQEPDAPYYCC